MVVVFVLGLIVSSLLERRAEVVSIYNNRKHIFKDAIVAQNELFAPRWSCYGLATPSLWSTTRLVATSTPSKI